MNGKVKPFIEFLGIAMDSKLKGNRDGCKMLNKNYKHA